MLRWIQDARAEMRTLRQLAEGAEEQAHRDGRSRPGPEDLVLASLALPDGQARRCLADVGVSPEQLADALAEQHRDALASGDAAAVRARAPRALGSPRGPFRATGAAEDVFRQIAEELKAEKARLSSARVLAVALDAERGPLVRALERLGVDRTELRVRARRAVAAGGD